MFKRLAAVIGLGLGVMVMMMGAGEPLKQDDLADARKQARKLQDAGNYKEAFAKYEELVLSPANSGKWVVDDFERGFNCLRNLRLQKDMDSFREKAITAHANDWRLLAKVARNYLDYDHYGAMIAGEFVRGHHRGGGKYMNSFERDRVRGLQLYEKAMALALKSEDAAHDRSRLFINYARALMGNSGYGESWRLQYLSDTSELPDYEDGHYRGSRGRSAPVDEDNAPVYHQQPASFADAQTDGERWRWALSEAARIYPDYKAVTLDTFAAFLRNQFGVQTMASYGFFGRGREADADNDESGPYDVHTLKENETLAKLATGIQRFEIPEEFNFISVYQQVADDKEGYAE